MVLPSAHWQGGAGYIGAPAAVSQWSDQSGSGHHMLQTVVADQPPTALIAGETGITANGSSFYLQTGNNFTYDLSHPHSLSAWVYLKAYPTAAVGRLLDYSTDSWIGITSTGLPTALHYTGSTNVQITGASSLSLNVWHLVVSTYDSTTLSLYTDANAFQASAAASGGRNIANRGISCMAGFGGGGSFLGTAPNASYLGSAWFDTVALSGTQILNRWGGGANA